MENNETITQSDLDQFIGTEQYHKLTFMPILFTDGMRYVAENCKAFWLMDLIASHLFTKPCWEDDGFISIIFRNKWVNFEDGNYKKLARQRVASSDFPMKEFKCFAQFNGETWVVMLPTEY